MLGLLSLAAQLRAASYLRWLLVVLFVALLAALAFAVLVAAELVAGPQLHHAVQSAHSALASGGASPMGCGNAWGPCW